MLASKVIAPILSIMCCMNMVCNTNAVSRPRGVSLTNTALYHPRADNSWLCLDGSKSIPFLQINDDFCDCADGSDEPGTAACANGHFHCLNVGHKPEDIPSSRVNDGICDCCDGSDEYVLVTCQNTCLELGEAELLKRKNTAELHKRGAEKREEMIKLGKQLKEERNVRRRELDERLKEQNALKAVKEQLKRNAEAIEAEALEAFKDQHAQHIEDVKPNDEPHQLREEASASFVQFDTNKDGFVEVSELMVDMSLDRDRNGIVTVEEAKFYLDERERVDLDAFITLAWPRIKTLKMLAEGLFKPPNDDVNDEANDMADIPRTEQENIKDVDQEALNTNEGRADIEPEEEDEEGEEDQYDDGEPDVGVGEAAPETEPTPEYDPETQRLVELANEARNAFSEIERQVRETEHEVKELEDQEAKDYGPNEEYATMDGECFKYEDREYVYTLCPFDRASQKQRSGGAETTLGRWDQWIGDGESKYNRQKYSHGASCWNGPQRSVIVEINCALESKITSVSEPNRCEYHMDFETPAACDSEAFAAAEQNLHDEL